MSEEESRHPELPPSEEGEILVNKKVEDLRAQVEEARSRGLEAHRRALLADNAGGIVPELVAGTTVEELDRSVEVARAAFETAKQAAIREFSANQVPAGNPTRQSPGIEGMSPLEKIAYGLRRDGTTG